MAAGAHEPRRPPGGLETRACKSCPRHPDHHRASDRPHRPSTHRGVPGQDRLPQGLPCHWEPAIPCRLVLRLPKADAQLRALLCEDLHESNPAHLTLTRLLLLFCFSDLVRFERSLTGVPSSFFRLFTARQFTAPFLAQAPLRTVEQPCVTRFKRPLRNPCPHPKKVYPPGCLITRIR